MSDESSNAPDAGREAPLAGKRLAEARRMRNISLQDVAKELHLDEPKVTALEQNRFEQLGAPVFVKGYLRKYAEVVGVPAEDVLADYRRCDGGDETPPIVGLRRPPSREFSPGPWLVALLAAAVATGGAWAWFSGGLEDLFPADRPTALAPFAAEEAPPQDAGSVPAETVPGNSEPEPVTPAPASAFEEPVEAAAVDADPPPVLEAPESEPAPEGQVALQLTFSGDCWTEVSDASGQRLYFGLGRAGETVSVTGEAPLHVLLGDRENATLIVDGENFPIPLAARRGKTARLTITGRQP